MMRNQIAAANWKMNLTYQQAEKLLSEILEAGIKLKPHHRVIFAVPYPYLIMAGSVVANENGYAIAAQNIYEKKNGAFTGEISVEMLQSLGVKYCIIGHSERREYFRESNSVLAEKIDLCLEYQVTPIFCCGEALEIREKNGQNEYVTKQLEESLFHLDENAVKNIIIAYEPIWAIGTGKTASPAQAQEMHAHIRSVIEKKYGADVASSISVLYGGSVKPSNSQEIFASPDVDGGLVGGASLVAKDFIEIIKSLK